MEHFVWDINPEIFSLAPYLGNYGPRYYGLLFALGFFVGYMLMQQVFRKEGRNEEDLSSLLLHLMLGTIIGARLGHCLFYEPLYYLANPLKILFVWQGGLASHGGTLGVLVAVILYARKHPDQSIPWLGSRMMAAICFTGTCIRIGNFFNSEIIGKPSELPWAVIFKHVDNVPRHPAMLYEASAYFILFLILQWRYMRYGRNINPYMQMGITFASIFTARFCLEFVKENQASFENGMLLNMGQLLSIPFVLVGLAMMSGLFERWVHRFSLAIHGAGGGGRLARENGAKVKKGHKKARRKS